MENTQQQHLALITEMIQTARKEFNENGAIYLLWGWIVFVASLTQFIMLQLHNAYNYMAWSVLVPAGLIGQAIIMIRQKKKERVKTILDRIMGYVWLAVGGAIGTTLFASGLLKENTFPMLLMVYAIGTFISGSVMQVKAMVWGAVSCWLIGIACFFIDFEYQLLFLSAAVLLAYIIPGYILKIRYRHHV